MTRAWMVVHELFQWARIEKKSMCDFGQELEQWRAIMCSAVPTY